MREFDAWLVRLACRPLPGAVSAAAVASAMGAGLIAKACRVTLSKEDLSPAGQARMQTALDLAADQSQVFLALAEADEAAYRAFLAEERHGPLSPAQVEARRQAIEVPVRLAEGCRPLLKAVPGLLQICWRTVCPDLEVCVYFLQTGLRTGLLVAEHNLQTWGGSRFAALEDRVRELHRLEMV